MTDQFTISVSEYAPHRSPAPDGGENINWGITVTASSNGRRYICSEFVGAKTEFDPHARNKGGGKGAVRESRPDDATIQKAVKRVKDSARKTLQTKVWVDHYDGGFWASPKEAEKYRD